jgi:hypothetical protein
MLDSLTTNKSDFATSIGLQKRAWSTSAGETGPKSNSIATDPSE